MSELISGKEALIALANGKDVEWNCKGFSGENWHSVLSSPHTKIGAVEILKREYGNDDVGYYSDVLFRLAPRTITINGIEVPAPFEPKVEDIYYFINSSNLKGYGFNKFSNDGDDECLTFYGAWRTEEEIKQVVAALRQVFGVRK